MPTTAALSVNEVVALSGVDEGKVRKDVEHGFFGSGSPPTFNMAALVYFRTLALMELQLGVEDRKRIYALIANALSASGKARNVELGSVLELKLTKVAAEVADMLARFQVWKKKIVENPKILGGEPVFPKSRLSIRHIGALVMNDGLDEIREDYPYLSDEDIEFAKLYTLAYPKRGRPRAHNASQER